MRPARKGRGSRSGKGFGRSENPFSALQQGFAGDLPKRVLSRDELTLLLLSLLAGEERHGYELIRAVKSLSGGLYAPSSGMVYPALSTLEADQLISETESSSGRRIFVATDSGRAKVKANAGELSDIKARLSELGAQDVEKLAPIERALTNLNVVISRAAPGASDDLVLDIAELIDESARKIERLQMGTRLSGKDKKPE